MQDVLKNNFKIIIGIIIGILISAITVCAAEEIFASGIKYDNSESGLTSTDVQSAINELNTKSNEWLNPNDMGTPQYYAFGVYKGWCSSTDTNCNSYADFPTTSTPPPSEKNVCAVKYEDGQYGVCIQRNGTEHCFRGRNYKVEAKHVQEVFSDISCDVNSSLVECDASDFYCCVDSNGDVSCDDYGTSDYCYVNSNGSVTCG